MRRGLLVGLGSLGAFVITAALLLTFMAGPLKESDYLVIGSVATLFALLALFVSWGVMTKSSLFIKRRKKN